MIAVLHVATDGLKSEGWAERPVKITVVIHDGVRIVRTLEYLIRGARAIGKWTSERFHVTTKTLHQKGVTINRALASMTRIMKQYNVKNVVSHNSEFAMGSIRNAAPGNENLAFFRTTALRCTMKKSAEEWYKLEQLCDKYDIKPYKNEGTTAYAKIVLKCYLSEKRSQSCTSSQSLD